ncbi:MAG: glycosyltransferase family 4 protein [Verrucomicrobia bacterium]|nr:glycosyltransferase family 4 protein [Verrucomicrobiota bacterium]
MVRRLAYLFERFPAFTKTFCAREVAELYRQNLRVPVFSIRRPNDDRPLNIPLNGVDIRYLPDSNGLRFKVLTRLAAQRFSHTWNPKQDPRDKHRFHEAIHLGPVLEKEGITALHAHFAGMATRTAWWTKRLFGIPYSFTGHANDIFVEKRDQRLPLGQLIQDAEFVATETDFSTQYLQLKFPESAGKIHRVYNGLDLDPFRQADPEAGSLEMLAIGRLIPKKGFDGLVRACNMLVSKGLQLRCRIVGAGPEHVPLRQLIDQFALSKFVELTGPKAQPEIVELLAQSNLFVFPAVEDGSGDRDNLPTVIIEAMASGLPVIATGLGGIGEIVTHQANGLIVPEGDADALADAIAFLAEHADLRKRYGQNGLAVVKEKFRAETTVKGLIELFQRYFGE